MNGAPPPTVWLLLLGIGPHRGVLKEKEEGGRLGGLGGLRGSFLGGGLIPVSLKGRSHV